MGQTLTGVGCQSKIFNKLIYGRLGTAFSTNGAKSNISLGNVRRPEMVNYSSFQMEVNSAFTESVQKLIELDNCKGKFVATNN